MSFGDVVAPVGGAAHNVRKGRIILVSVGRVYEFLDAVSTVTVGPAVLWSGQG